MKSSWSLRRTASWSASVVRGSLARAVRSSMPRATAWVMSASQSRSLGPAWDGGPSPVGRAGTWPWDAGALEHAASSADAGSMAASRRAARADDAIHRMMHRC